MGYLRNFARAFDKEQSIKNRLNSMDKDKKDKILAICRKLRKRDINEFLNEADMIMKHLNEGKTFEDIEKIYGLNSVYQLGKEEVANGWKFRQIGLGRVVK